ncbi:histidine phosphatase family protein [Sphingomonas sp.]|jgi:probable phosphoglycerate mutase|uniref:histidine phosphatase family protein n=1 Tax=Sphingomonas sp. TaxID=28214 RepID=UPI002DE67C8B|nr:histidine phosphatase family protein [Sphingomonas sp.]
MFAQFPGRFFIARHGETVFNAAGRMQGDAMDTPLTRAGFAQVDAMGEGLVRFLGDGARPAHLWASPYGRALQTLAIVCEHIGADWHRARRDQRLSEINVGIWGGRTYREIIEEQGEIVDRSCGLFSARPPQGEWYDEIAARLTSWLEEHGHEDGDKLIIMHGMSSRVLRGLMTGIDVEPRWSAPIAPSLPQGSMVMIEGGVETVVHLGAGHAPA